MITKNKSYYKKALIQTQQYSWLKNIANFLNYLFYLKLGAFEYGSIRPIISYEDRFKLKEIPTGAGNILVGPHPGNQDAQLLFHLISQSRKGPVLFLMAAETYYGGTLLRRWLLKNLGVIPINRGKSSAEVIENMADYICKGWWGGLYPEGDVFFSRDVMPMEIGFLRIAIRSALKIQKEDRSKIKSIGHPRPVFITPFAHVYFLRNADLSLKRVIESVGELEQRFDIKIEKSDQHFTDRLIEVMDKVLGEKAEEYGIVAHDWKHPDRFERIRLLQVAVLEDLERKYIGSKQVGFERRRAMKIRAKCIDSLENISLSQIDRNEIERDIKKIREIILMTPFNQNYKDKYGDLEMWVEYMRRIRTALAIPKKDFGPEDVVFKILEPVDVHPMAEEYQSISTNEGKKDFLIRKTEEFRKIIQSGVDDICNKRLTKKVSY